MPTFETERVRAIAGRLRDYLDAHPHAADTLDGIIGWWLPQPESSADPAEVQQALDYLVARHEMVRIQSADGHVLYARDNPQA